MLIQSQTGMRQTMKQVQELFKLRVAAYPSSKPEVTDIIGELRTLIINASEPSREEFIHQVELAIKDIYGSLPKEPLIVDASTVLNREVYEDFQNGPAKVNVGEFFTVLIGDHGIEIFPTCGLEMIDSDSVDDILSVFNEYAPLPEIISTSTAIKKVLEVLNAFNPEGSLHELCEWMNEHLPLRGWTIQDYEIPFFTENTR